MKTRNTMKQINKEDQEVNFVNDMEYEIPNFPKSFGFKFVYLQAIDPDFAANLIESLKEEE